MKQLRKLCLTPSFLLTPATAAFAQEQPAMADVMRSNGKIYVVVGVLLIILAGLIVYLFSLDRKQSKIEKKLK